jgi:hypothetical protein
LLIFAATLASSVGLPPAVSTARAAELDKKGKSDAREAMRLYKEGNYEDAAKVFARLSVNYPEMLVFVRNLGACYYYLRRWEPAISNLRDYEHRKKDIAADDRAEIAGWIGEMERLRDQAMIHAAPAAPAATDAVAPAVAAVPVPAAAAVPSGAPSESPPPSPGAPVATDATAVAPDVAATAVPGPPPTTTEPAAEQAQTYPPAQWGSSSTYPPGPYGAQPTYPQSQYPYGPYPYQTNPSAAPQGYGPYAAAAPSGAVAAAPPARSSGRKVAAWILGVTGVAAVGVGAVCTFKALDDFSKVQKKYDPKLEDEGKKLATAQWVGYGVGGALLLTAIIVGSSGGGSASGVALAPAVGSGSAGATLAGTF